MDGSRGGDPRGFDLWKVKGQRFTLWIINI